MLDDFLKVARKQIIQTRQSLASVTRSFAKAICPSDNQNDLKICFTEAADFQRFIISMINKKSPELHELSSYLDFYQPSSYSGLMTYFVKNQYDWDKIGLDIGDEEPVLLSYHRAYPGIHYLCRTAERFIEAFDRLPRAVQVSLNCGLHMHERNTPSQVRKACWVKFFPEQNLE